MIWSELLYAVVSSDPVQLLVTIKTQNIYSYNLFFFPFFSSLSGRPIQFSPPSSLLSQDNHACIPYNTIMYCCIDNRVNERDWKRTLATRNASWDHIVYLSVTYGTILFHWSKLWSQLASSSTTMFSLFVQLRFHPTNFSFVEVRVFFFPS